LDKPIIVSNGFVIPLAVAVAVFSKEPGAFATIVGNTSIHSKGVHFNA
jgi:ACR3 family arsenite efflux pump ArsB